MRLIFSNGEFIVEATISNSDGFRPEWDKDGSTLREQ